MQFMWYCFGFKTHFYQDSSCQYLHIPPTKHSLHSSYSFSRACFMSQSDIFSSMNFQYFLPFSNIQLMKHCYRCESSNVLCVYFFFFFPKQTSIGNSPWKAAPCPKQNLRRTWFKLITIGEFLEFRLQAY